MKNYFLLSQDEEGVSCVYSATHFGHVGAVRMLIEYKANVTVTNHDGGTPLHLAAADGNTSLIKLLIEGECISINNLYMGSQMLFFNPTEIKRRYI